MGSKYVTNKELIPMIERYKTTGKMEEDLGRAILRISKGLAQKPNFSGYTWKEDMIQEGVLTVCKYLKNFDATKSDKPNPFSYITQICYNSFINYIKKQNKHGSMKNLCYEYRDVLTSDEDMNCVDYTIIVKNKEKV